MAGFLANQWELSGEKEGGKMKESHLRNFPIPIYMHQSSMGAQFKKRTQYFSRELFKKKTQPCTKVIYNSLNSKPNINRETGE